VDRVDVFIADLKDSVREAKLQPEGKGTMVAVYGTRWNLLPSFHSFISSILLCTGLGNSSAVGPAMVGQLATAFLDTLYKA
jgi:sphinganine-1-phosphate aldolase